MKYKVGDWIRYKSSSTGNYAYTKIKKIDGRDGRGYRKLWGDWFKADGSVSGLGGTGFMPENQVELVTQHMYDEDKKNMVKKKFKTGDRVIIHKPTDVTEAPFWSEEMDKFDSKEMTIDYITQWAGIDGWEFNLNWLEPVPKPLTATYGGLTAGTVASGVSSLTATQLFNALNAISPIQMNVQPPIRNTMNNKKKKKTKSKDGVSVGDIVRFVGDGKQIPSSYHSNAPIPNGLIEANGTTRRLGDAYAKDGAKVIGIYEPWYLLEWHDQDGRVLKLGFPRDAFTLTKKSVPVIKFDETKLDLLVLDEEKKKDILALLRQSKHSDKIFNTWGLGETIEYGKGQTMLFHGGPGTGKTWGANCIAKAVGKELLVVNVANIQTSEPGGANRNIEDAFKSAKDGNKVLFLDECDGLICSRDGLGMVLSGEVNTLLTEIEKFEGICILATNRIATLDEALERRLALIVEFTDPNYENRKKIWETLIPKKMPVCGEFSYDKLAEYVLTGGQIKNAILHAARKAAGDELDEVKLAHFTEAITKIQKTKGQMGKRPNWHQSVIQVDVTKGE